MSAFEPRLAACHQRSEIHGTAGGVAGAPTLFGANDSRPSAEPFIRRERLALGITHSSLVGRRWAREIPRDCRPRDVYPRTVDFEMLGMADKS